jgi:hypothetical protein
MKRLKYKKERKNKRLHSDILETGNKVRIYNKHNVDDGNASNVLSAMSLDDMLEASTALDLIKHKQDIKNIKSDKARQYVRIVTKLSGNNENIKIVDNMMNRLADRIVLKNSSEIARMEIKNSLYREPGIENVKPLVVKAEPSVKWSRLGKSEGIKKTVNVKNFK